MLARLYRWPDRHPLVVDFALAAGLLGISLGVLFDETPDPGVAAVVLSAALTVPLALRRRAPVPVFAVVMLACGAELVFLDDFIAANLGVMVALYTLVAYAPRPLGAIGFGVALAGTVPSVLHFEDAISAGFVLTWLVFAVHVVLAAALGDRRRAQLRAREALEQRTRMLAAERDQQATIATGVERARIARELHDVVAHSLSVVIAQADGGRYAAEQDPRAATAALHTISATAREALAETRRALGVLREEPHAPMEPQPGADELAALVARTRESGLRVALTEEGRARSLPPAAGLAVYRVAQEALTNVLKHAGTGASATVLLRWEPERVTLVVRDDGAGSDAPDDGRGRGLTGMRERVEPRGGALTAGPHPDGGFEVRAVIPVEAVRAAAGRGR